MWYNPKFRSYQYHHCFIGLYRTKILVCLFGWTLLYTFGHVHGSVWFGIDENTHTHRALSFSICFIGLYRTKNLVCLFGWTLVYTFGRIHGCVRFGIDENTHTHRALSFSVCFTMNWLFHGSLQDKKPGLLVWLEAGVYIRICSWKCLIWYRWKHTHAHTQSPIFLNLFYRSLQDKKPGLLVWLDAGVYIRTCSWKCLIWYRWKHTHTHSPIFFSLSYHELPFFGWHFTFITSLVYILYQILCVWGGSF